MDIDELVATTKPPTELLPLLPKFDVNASIKPKWLMKTVEARAKLVQDQNRAKGKFAKGKKSKPCDEAGATQMLV